MPISTMKLRTVFGLTAIPFTHPAHSAALALFGWLWLLLLPLALLNGADAGNTVLTKLACLFMALHCAGQMDTLHTAKRKLQNRRAPSAAWTRCAHAGLYKISLAWLLLTAGMTLHYTLSLPAMHWAGAGAMLSVMACLGSAASLRGKELRQAAWHWLGYAAIAMLVAMGAAHIAFGTGKLLAWFGALPPAVLLPLLFSWPALTGWLYLRWRGVYWRSAVPTAASASMPNRSSRLRHHLQRYTLLNEGVLQIDGSTKSPGTGQSWMFVLVLPACAFQSMRAAWGGDMDGFHFMGMFSVTMLSTTGMVMRDLHWRHLLAPGGVREHRIALNIYFSTLLLYLAILLVAGTGVALLDCLVRGQAPTQALDKMAMHSVVIPEVALALAVGMLIKGTGQWARVAAVLILFFLVIALVWTRQMPNAALLHAGYGYAATLLLATGAVLLLARRVWTVRKLQPYLRQG